VESKNMFQHSMLYWVLCWWCKKDQ